MSTERGRHRPKPQANHHLYLRGGVWWTRFERDGRTVRQSTGFRKSEVADARKVRDRLMTQNARASRGIEEYPEAVSIGKLIELYLDEQSRPYDREKGGEQPGTKKDASADRVIVKRLRKAGLDFGLRADLLDTTRIFELGLRLEKMKRCSGRTRRNTFRLLRCIYSWARRERNRSKTGIVTNPFDDLDRSDRTRLFPNRGTEAPPFRPEQLRAVCDRLPAHASRPVRFAAHSGMRWQSEVLRMKWGHVDFERRVCPTTPYAKRGKVRDVPLSDVALEILRAIRPENPADEDPVWLNAKGGPLRDVRSTYETAVRKVCSVPAVGYRYPDFHSLRRTCASALAQVAPTAVVGAVLGHARETVTDRYITVPVEAQIAALNSAAELIDGGNVTIFPKAAVNA